jgi:hypothetical protein
MTLARTLQAVRAVVPQVVAAFEPYSPRRGPPPTTDPPAAPSGAHPSHHSSPLTLNVSIPSRMGGSAGRLTNGAAVVWSAVASPRTASMTLPQTAAPMGVQGVGTAAAAGGAPRTPASPSPRSPADVPRAAGEAPTTPAAVLAAKAAARPLSAAAGRTGGGRMVALPSQGAGAAGYSPAERAWLAEREGGLTLSIEATPAPGSREIAAALQSQQQLQQQHKGR